MQRLEQSLPAGREIQKIGIQHENTVYIYIYICIYIYIIDTDMPVYLPRFEPGATK